MRKIFRFREIDRHYPRPLLSEMREFGSDFMKDERWREPRGYMLSAPIDDAWSAMLDALSTVSIDDRGSLCTFGIVMLESVLTRCETRKLVVLLRASADNQRVRRAISCCYYGNRPKRLRRAIAQLEPAMGSIDDVGRNE